MGASPHERVVDLWRDGPMKAVRTGKRIARPWPQSGYTDEVIWKKGRRQRVTPEEAWQRVYDEEGYEDGHSYSGTFGSKHGMVVLARNEKLDPLLRELGSVLGIYQGYYKEDDPYHPLKVQGKVHCSCFNGRVRSVPGDWNSPVIDCPACKGSGRRYRTPEERAEARKKVNARKKLIALLGDATLRRINAVYDDKWGPAAAVVGKDFVWFGGYCPS